MGNFHNVKPSNPGDWTNATPQNPCKICGKKRLCSESTDGKMACCYKESHSNAYDLVKTGNNVIGDYWVYALEKSGVTSRAAPPPTKPAKIKTEIPTASPEARNRVYRALLDRLDLSTAHRDNMRARGLSDEEITRLGYRTMPINPKKIAYALSQEFPEVAAGTVPGIHKTLSAWNCMAIPVLNVAGQIIALLMRPDDPGEDGPKYFWFSTKDGASPGAPPHIPKHDPEMDVTTIGITEGIIKADIATAKSGMLYIGISGVGNHAPVKPILEEHFPDSTVRLAIDTDCRRKRIVAGHLASFSKSINFDFDIEIETWDESDGKGIDDVLAAGKTTKIITGNTVFPEIERILEEANAADPPESVKALAAARELLDVETFRAALDADIGHPFKDEILDALDTVELSDKVLFARLSGVLKGRGLADVKKAIAARRADKKKSNVLSLPIESPDTDAPDAPQSAADGVDKIVTELNKTYAIASIGANAFILRERLQDNRPVVEFLSRRDFDLLHSNRFCTVPAGPFGNETKEVKAAKAWLEHPARRQYNQVIFDPSRGPFHNGNYNLWRGFAVKPVPGDWSQLKNHIRENICSGDAALYAYVLAWMADAVQKPSERPGTALVLRGKQGVGKGIFCTWFGAIFGCHFKQVSHARHLTGHFNAHLMNLLLLFIDEAFWAGDKQGEAILKALITENDFMVEFKGRDPFSVKNNLRLLIASNSDWVVPAGAEERRFVVMDVADTHMQDTAYFTAIIDQMKSGGLEAMLNELLAYDCKCEKVDLRVIPQTAALFEQKIRSMGSVEKFLYGRLVHGSIRSFDEEWPDVVPVKSIHNEYIKESDSVRVNRRAYEVEFGMILKKLFPDIKRAKRTIKSIDEFGNPKKYKNDSTQMERVWCYELPDLETCRKRFSEAMKFEINWEEILEEKVSDHDFPF